MDADSVKWIIDGLLVLVMYFFKRSNDKTDADIKVLESEIKNIKETRVHKDDFKDFKQELRLQFDEVKQAIRDIKPHA